MMRIMQKLFLGPLGRQEVQVRTLCSPSVCERIRYHARL